ncbi:DUF4176 domain-containing protein [Xylocopilactobacillus apicola]|uniref:Type II secretion protein n=1 Tax=Xylocopilactobacillus apicola TaxID=2932184 RepID=A0AAU9DHI1_9LACO|nr:DUF4176 domain-containing protein [Xylocopilactobacillus apicola]BDR59460.1 type II secretion protein [Xylocopilactobacillus apicola]
MNEKKELLPIGSIVYLEEGTKKLMIVGRGVVYEEDGEDKFKDYMACLYPEGIDPKETIFFDQEDIDQLVFKGYSDEEEERFVKLYEDWVKENKK